MNMLSTILKALSRMNAFTLLFLTGPVLMAQESTNNSRSGAESNTGQWYDQGWIWFLIIVLAIVLILAFTRKTDQPGGQNRFKDKR